MPGMSPEKPSWLELLAGRRSIRRYRPDPIATTTIERILTAACWAPSAHNRQPWRFALLRSLSWKDRLARAMGERLRAERLRDGDPPCLVDEDVARSYKRIAEAPIVILVALDMADMDRYPDGRQRAEHLMAVQSTAMATQNLLLAAHAEGLGACWMCAPLFCPDRVKGCWVCQRIGIRRPSSRSANRRTTASQPRGCRSAQCHGHPTASQLSVDLKRSVSILMQSPR